MRLTAHALRLERDGRTVLRELTLAADPGCVLGVIGPNGSGKSTLLRALAGLAPAAAGSVHVDGRDIHRLRPRARAPLLAYLPQDTTVAFEFTARDVVLLGRYAHRPRFAAPSTRDTEIADRALRQTGTEHLADRPVTRLSGGERQLVYLAKSLAQDAGVLLLDEPVSALDLRHQLRVLSLIRAQAAEGRAVVVVLHDLDQAARHCDRLALLHGEELCALGTPDQVLTPEVLRATYGVRARVTSDDVTGALRVIPLTEESGVNP